MRLNYTLFGVLLLLWSGCDFSEPEPEIEPPTVVEKDPVDIKVYECPQTSKLAKFKQAMRCQCRHRNRICRHSL